MLRFLVKKFLLSCFLVLLLGQLSFAVTTKIKCDSTAGASSVAISTIDTVTAVVIYCGEKGTGNSFPNWGTKIWDTTAAQRNSIPNLYKDNSYGLYRLTGYIADTATKSHKVYISTCCSLTAPTGGYGFVANILGMVDQDINFGLYDSDDNDFVDAIFLIVLDPSIGDGGNSMIDIAGEYVTQDSNPRTHHLVKIRGTDGVIARFYRSLATQGEAVGVCAHEYGHHLGLPDLYLPSPRGVGGFSIMAGVLWDDVIAPFDPWSKEHLSWVTPVEVNAPVWNRELKDFNTYGEIYKFKRNNNEYFLLTRHWGSLRPDSAKIWEQNFPGGGVFILHIDNSIIGGCFVDCPDSFHKRVDVENSHGLYDWSGTIPGNPDDSAGLDSMDRSHTLYFGSATSFYNSTTKTHFDATTNPSSDGYYKHSTLGWIQNQQTNIAVRDIQGNGTGNMYANLFKTDNVYGVITGPLSFSKTSYTIKGDLTINSGASLTINSGAKIQFSANSDNQSSGVDITKGEIIVSGTLNVIGTSTDSAILTSISTAPGGGVSDTDWYGIRVLSGGSAKLKYAQIKHAYIGASYENSASDTVSNCLFDSNYVYGVKAWNNNLVIRNCTFKNMPIGYGVQSYTYTPKIENNRFDSLKYGVSAGRATITGNKFIGASGISERAISCDDGNPSTATVTSDTVAGTFSDAYLESYKSKANITNCVLGDTTSSTASIGIRAIVNATAFIRNSNIMGYTSKGVYGRGGQVDLGDVELDEGGSNNILTTASGTKSVWNTSSTTLKAERNWWGQAPPPSSLFQGSVDYFPYLTAPGGPAKLLAHQLPISDNIPKTFAVSQNYPNPFNPTTVIEYSIPVASKVTVRVYNILGQQVKKLFEGEKLAGTYTVEWNGTNESGKKVSSGIYLYIIKAGEFKETKKMTLIR